jgi:trehalose 6-phosphate synthase
VLSQFAGVASYFDEALIVNPHDPDEIADALHLALTMPLDERKRRHKGLTDRLRGLTAANFSARFLAALSGDPQAESGLRARA